MNFKGAIFDMDGTLVDSLILWDVLWREFGKMYLNDETFRPSEEDDKAVRTLTLKDAMQLIHKNYSIGESGNQLLSHSNKLMLNFYSEKVEMKNGAKEFLEYCHKNGVIMCIASATSPDLIKLALKHCDIEKYFLKIFSCADVGAGKEKPDVFLKAQQFLGTEIHETCVFEDSLVAIKTANKTGFKTVGIYDRYNFGQEEIKKTADIYIDKGETLIKIVK